MIKIKKKDKAKKSFYFEEYQQFSKKNSEEKFIISHDRIYLLFFIFFTLIFIFAIKIITISFQDSKGIYISKNFADYKATRSDIVDRNGFLIARNIIVYDVGIKEAEVKIEKPQVNEEALNKLADDAIKDLKKMRENI